MNDSTLNGNAYSFAAASRVREHRQTVEHTAAPDSPRSAYIDQLLLKRGYTRRVAGRISIQTGSLITPVPKYF